MVSVKGPSGLTRRQKASLAVTGESFPPLPKSRVSFNPLITNPRDESMMSYVGSAASRISSLRNASSYLSMLVNPFTMVGHRYPDETIVPTGLVRFNASTTYTVDAPAVTNGFYAFCDWKARIASNAIDFNSTIIYPTAFSVAPTYRDYGTPQSTWAAISTIDRTLACALRIRHVGLPVSTFVPSGTLYFLQIQSGETPTTYSTETAAIQAVVARKGFSLTCAELSRLGGAVHIPYLPQGPMSYVFSQSVDGASGFPDGITPISQSVAANNGLLVVGFGLQAGVILRVDYAHHVEYIPGVAAAGLVETKVELPSVETREKIAAGAQSVHRIIGGGTSATSLGLFGGSTSPFGGGSGSTLSSMIGSLGSAAGEMVGSPAFTGLLKSLPSLLGY